MNTRSYDDVKKAIIAKNYQFFRGNYNLNFIGERTNDIYTNAFTDWMHLVYETPGAQKCQTFRWTTKPGLYGEGAVLQPKWINGFFGTFCLKPGQYLGAYEMRNMEQMDVLKSGADIIGSPWANPYLHQVGNLTGFRDGTKDLTITKDQEETGNWFGVNGHYMGLDETPQSYMDDNLNNWSLGCQGAPRVEWFKICQIFYYCMKYQGPGLSYTLLETKDFGYAAKSN